MMLITFTIMLTIYSFTYPILVLPLVCILGFGLIGFIDDYTKMVLKKSDGIPAMAKIIGLFITIAIFIYLYLNVFNLSTAIIIPYFGVPVTLSVPIFIAFTVFVMLGTSNSVNLTDGLDGLATGVVSIIMTFFTIRAYISADTDMMLLGIISVGTCLGFLVFNTYPAKIFMGDTGSLALGGAVVSIAIILKMPLYLIIVAIICILETLSVIMQVIYFKITKGKRLFKMAPLHHHFELCGIKENVITCSFYLVTFLACILAYYV